MPEAWKGQLCVLLLTAALASPVQAQDGAAGPRTRTPFPVPRTTQTLTLDGAIAETLWEQALVLELRYEVQPGSLLEREWEGYISYNGPRQSFVLYGGGVGQQIWNGIRIDRRFQSAFAEFQASADVRVGSRANWGGTVDFSQIRPADVRAGRTFVDVNAGRHVSVRFSHNYELLDVAGGRLYSAHVPEVRVVYQRDLRTMARIILQYSDVTRNPSLYMTTVARESRDFFTQLLFSYKVNAQTALYFGYISGASATERAPLTQTNRTVFGKVSYAWVK